MFQRPEDVGRGRPQDVGKAGDVHWSYMENHTGMSFGDVFRTSSRRNFAKRVCAQSFSNFHKFINKSLSFLADCIAPSIQNKSHISLKLQGHEQKFPIRRHKKLKICQQTQTTREEGKASTAISCKLKGVTLLIAGKCLDYGNLWISLKMQFQEFLGEKSPTLFPHESFCWFFEAEMFLEVEWKVSYE